MSFNLNLLQEQLCKALCSEVTLRRTTQGHTQIATPFSFPDGDLFQVYIEDRPGFVRLTDYGHTWMHMSYENDLAKFSEGTRAKILEQILVSFGVRNEGGQLIMDTTLDKLGESVLRYAQALTRIYDVTLLNRERVVSTFYEDLRQTIFQFVPSEAVAEEYILPDHPDAESYPIDFRIEARHRQLFLFGIATRDKARLVTITLEHWLRAQVDFDSLLIFQDQQEIPRRDIARLSNIGGEMIASLDARDAMRRKIQRLTYAGNN